MLHPFDYIVPKTLKEACHLLWEVDSKAKVVAGGTDLVIGLRNEDFKPGLLIDITSLKELRGIEETDGALFIGAAVTHSEIASSPLVKRYGMILSKAASEIGSPQIRNLGTIGGNIVNGSPAADTLPPLIVLDAVGKVFSRDGERSVPVAQLLEGPYKTSLKPPEILAGVSFKKLPQDMKSGYTRLARRHAMAIARMSIALLLRVRGGKIQDIRVSPGAILPTPQRLSEVEEFLKGKPLDEKFFIEASRKVSEAMIRRSGVRPSASYKIPVVESLFLRTMKMALTPSPSDGGGRGHAAHAPALRVGVNH
jgi:CO/xanthine dehydrogenase FAD-binding subunit